MLTAQTANGSQAVEVGKGGVKESSSSKAPVPCTKATAETDVSPGGTQKQNYPKTETTEGLELKQNSLFSRMGKELEALRDLVTKKVRTLGAKEHVDELIRLFNGAANTSREIQSLRRATAGVSGKVVADTNQISIAVRNEVKSALELSYKDLKQEVGAVVTCHKCNVPPAKAATPGQGADNQMLKALADVQAKLAIQDEKISARARYTRLDRGD